MKQGNIHWWMATSLRKFGYFPMFCTYVVNHFTYLDVAHFCNQLNLVEEFGCVKEQSTE